MYGERGREEFILIRSAYIHHLYNIHIVLGYARLSGGPTPAPITPQHTNTDLQVEVEVLSPVSVAHPRREKLQG